MQIVMENPNHPNEPNEDIPEENPVIPEPNHVEDAHDPNEMVNIPDDEELLDYDKDDAEEPEEEPEQNNGHGNQFAQHPNPQSGNMNAWLEEDDDVNENVNNEDINDEDVEVEVDDDAELIFPYEVEGDQTPPPRDESSDSEPPNAESSDSELEDQEIDVSPKVDVAPEVDIAPEATALRRNLETSRARARLTEAELSTNQTEIAPLKSKDTIEEKEKEILNHDLENVKRALGNVLERVSVLESGENATLKKRLTETETKLVWARMERDIVERRLHESRVWNKMFYSDMVHIGAVLKPPSDDEETEHPRKKLKDSTSDGTEGPSEPRGPPISRTSLLELYSIRWIMPSKAMSEVHIREVIREQVATSMAGFMANINRRAGGDEAGGAGASGAGADGAGAGSARAGCAEVGGARPAAPEITGCTYITFMKCDP
ncbi:hypothetical protein Tco_1480490, partial [Tanacetum coccineum]